MKATKWRLWFGFNILAGFAMAALGFFLWASSQAVAMGLVFSAHNSISLMLCSRARKDMVTGLLNK